MQTKRKPPSALWGSILPVAIALVSLSLSGCRDKGSVPDPCQGAKANPLTIRFLESTGTPTPDTAYTAQTITFEAPGAPYTSYEWQVGSAANMRTVRRFALDFPDVVTGNIPVRLIARRPPNSSGCFPKDDGVDTLTTTLTLMAPGDLRAPIYGKFQGANRDAPRDTFTVRVYLGKNYDFPNNPAAPPMNYLIGLPKGCRQPYYELGLRWRGVFASSGGCTGFNAQASMPSRDSIRIEHRAAVSPVIIDKVFLGKRIR